MHLGKTVEQEYAYNLNVDNTTHELGKIEVEKDIGVMIDSTDIDIYINQKQTKQTVS